MIRATVLLLPLLTFSSALSAQSGNVAIECDVLKGRSEIYIISANGRSFSFFNQKTKLIEPVCFGKCNWNSTVNKVSFDTDTGFIRSATINRVTGRFTGRSAFGQQINRACHRIKMPPTARNRF